MLNNYLVRAELGWKINSLFKLRYPILVFHLPSKRIILTPTGCCKRLRNKKRVGIGWVLRSFKRGKVYMFIEEARIAHYSHSQYIIIGEKDLEEIIQNEYVLEEIKRAGKL